MIESEKIFVNNSTPTIQEEVIILRIENEQLKKELESYKVLDSHYDEIEEDAKRIAEENEGLKRNLKRYSETIAEQEETIDAQDEKINFYVSRMNKALIENEQLKAQITDIKEDVERERNKQRRLEHDFTTDILNNLLNKWELAK